MELDLHTHLHVSGGINIWKNRREEAISMYEREKKRWGGGSRAYSTYHLCKKRKMSSCNIAEGKAQEKVGKFSWQWTQKGWEGEFLTLYALTNSVL